jgi:hypothetical protein
VDETALLDSDHKAVRAGLNQAHGGIFFIPHLHRFFGGPARAEFHQSDHLDSKSIWMITPLSLLPAPNKTITNDLPK